MQPGVAMAGLSASLQLGEGGCFVGGSLFTLPSPAAGSESARPVPPPSPSPSTATPTSKPELAPLASNFLLQPLLTAFSTISLWAHGCALFPAARLKGTGRLLLGVGANSYLNNSLSEGPGVIKRNILTLLVWRCGWKFVYRQ